MKDFGHVWLKKTVVFTTIYSKRLRSFRLRIESFNPLNLAVSRNKATYCVVQTFETVSEIL